MPSVDDPVVIDTPSSLLSLASRLENMSLIEEGQRSFDLRHVSRDENLLVRIGGVEPCDGLRLKRRAPSQAVSPLTMRS